MLYSNTGKRALILSLLMVMLFALVVPAQAGNAVITGQVFVDSDGNSQPDQGEKGLAGAQITLIKVDGGSEAIIGQTTSDNEGAWRFDSLVSGEYYLTSVLPDNHFYAVPTPGGSIMLPGQGQSSRSPLFSVAEGEQSQKFIGTHRKSAYINLIAFGDLNMNSGRMSNEPLLRDVKVNLIYEYEGKPYIITEGITNKDGELQLRDLSPATYRIGVTMPEPYIIGPLGTKLNLFYNTVPPSETNYGESEPFELERSIGLGIGGVKAGTLNGRVWMDSNMNATIDADEGGYPGIEITLTHNTLGVGRNLTTTQDSQYSFEYLQAGDYTISATLPDGVMFALPGSPSVFQKAYSDEQNQTLYISDEGATKFEAIGVMPSSSVTLTAFIDSTVDGVMDEAEPAFSGALVEILDQGQVMTSAQTDAQGQAVLERVRGGEITVRVSLPDGQVFTVPGGENGNAYSSLGASAVLEVVKTVGHGQNLPLYAGTTLPSAISGTLFDGSNLSSVLDANEAGLAGFTVQAVNENGEVASETTTDASGRYTLDKLVPASYKVRFLLVSPYVFSNAGTNGQPGENKVVEQTVDYGQTDWVILAAGETVENLDAGAFRSAVIRGSVLLGDDIIGFEGQSGGLQGVKVDLLDENGAPVSEHTTAMTDDSGAFSLKGALQGTYSLRFTLPEDAKYSQPLLDDASYTTQAMEVKASDELSINPLYVVKTGTISGLAYEDINNDGMFATDSDAPLAAVHIALVNSATQEQYDTQSAQDGTYEIKGIRPGNYQLTVTLNEGYSLDYHDNSLAPAAISGDSQKTLDISMGQQLTNTVLSAVKPIIITGTAYYDNDLNREFDSSLDSPYPLQFTLTHERTGTLLSLSADEQGGFTTASAFPGTYQVVLNLPADHLLYQPQDAKSATTDWRFNAVLNADSSRLDLGIVQLGSFSGTLWNMDGSRNDVANLPITLFDTKGAQLAQTTTNEEGSYNFNDLYPIEYRVEVSLPEGYRFAREVDTAQKPSIILSDLVGADKEQGQSQAIKLNMGEQKTAQDIGMGAMGRLGDFAWLDLDKDGMQDAGEPGIPGLVIKLYQYGQLSAQATTDEFGRYLFTGLFPGSYTLVVTMPAEIKPTLQQTDFRLVASVLNPSEEQTARAEGIVVPSGGRNLNADLGFILRQEGRYPEALNDLPTKDWTKVNQQQPKR